MVLAALIVGMSFGRAFFPKEEARGEQVESKPLEWKFERRHAPGSRPRPPMFQRIHGASPDELPDLLGELLEGEPDRVRRIALIMEIFSLMDEGNAVPMFLTFTETNERTGQKFDQEWEILMDEMGRAGGRTAVEFHMNDPRGKGSWGIERGLFGWSQRAPNEALAWIREDMENRGQFLNFVLGGQALVSPDAAEKTLHSLPLEEQRENVESYVWNLAQGAGVDAAVDWVAGRAASFQDPLVLENAKDCLLKRMAATTSMRRTIKDRIDQLERVHAVSPIKPDDLSSTVRSMRGVEVLDLLAVLETHESFAHLAGDPRLVASAIGKAGENWEEWRAAHPEARFAEGF